MLLYRTEHEYSRKFNTQTQYCCAMLESNESNRLSGILLPLFEEIIQSEKLDRLIMEQFYNVYLPLASWISSKNTDGVVVIGINGAQGSGKSTLSRILNSFLFKGFGKRSVILSIDDLYLSKLNRKKLATDIHGLLEVRGVPGTHDVSLGKHILSSLKDGSTGDRLLLPSFDKAQDDLIPESQWQPVMNPVDVILFEGWCVGSLPQRDEELSEPVNRLEMDKDPDLIWRKYVNDQLRGPYSELFQYIDHTIMLQVPDMESVYEWRSLQERKLGDQRRKLGESTDQIMSDEQVEEFIMYYERITRHTLNEMPGRADVLLKLNKQHQVDDVRIGR